MSLYGPHLGNPLKGSIPLNIDGPYSGSVLFGGVGEGWGGVGGSINSADIID